MKRRTIFAALTIGLVVSTSVAAQNPEQRLLRVDQIKDNVYVLKGGGGNTTVFVTTTGVVVIDSKDHGWGQPIIDAIKTITDKPITTLINTGPDLDHVGGNAEFPANVRIIAQRNTKKRMEKAGLAGRALPALTKSTCTTSAPVTPTETRGSSSRRWASCMPATSFQATTCRSSTRSAAGARWRSARPSRTPPERSRVSRS
jgi:hypothetical protein